jgi:hypothetical protein
LLEEMLCVVTWGRIYTPIQIMAAIAKALFYASNDVCATSFTSLKIFAGIRSLIERDSRPIPADGIHDFFS